ncbi:hypothetical protein P7K49_005306 [Saguinus oedipus]|uniref:Uncharacterized protein n=1 Tax=Saguinus oedipus TaxID=9490 RepID=A0ABQ9WBI7_SAGOE|nr:hypothetical protein P7K49_005306 [Saguinus oedipus]
MKETEAALACPLATELFWPWKGAQSSSSDTLWTELTVKVAQVSTVKGQAPDPRVLLDIPGPLVEGPSGIQRSPLQVSLSTSTQMQGAADLRPPQPSLVASCPGLCGSVIHHSDRTHIDKGQSNDFDSAF